MTLIFNIEYRTSWGEEVRVLGLSLIHILVNQCFVTAVGAFLAFGFRAVLDVFLQGAFHTVLPGVDVFAVQLQ